MIVLSCEHWVVMLTSQYIHVRLQLNEYFREFFNFICLYDFFFNMIKKSNSA